MVEISIEPLVREGVVVSAKALGGSLAAGEPMRRASSSARASRGVDLIASVERVAPLAEVEEHLLRVFVAHRGQCLTTERLRQLMVQAGGMTAEVRSLTCEEIALLAKQVDNKLASAQMAWRIREMADCGYILWH